MGYKTQFAENEISDFLKRVKDRAETIQVLRKNLEAAEKAAADQNAAAARALEDQEVDPVIAAAEDIKAKRLRGQAARLASDLKAAQQSCPVTVQEMANMIGKVNGAYHEQIQRCNTEIGARCSAVLEEMDKVKEIDREHHQLVMDLFTTLQAAGAPGFMAHSYEIADLKDLSADQAALVQMYHSAEGYHVFGMSGSADRLIRALKEAKTKFN